MIRVKRSGVAAVHAEKWISAAGGFIGIALVMWVSGHYLGMQGASLLIASTGASAVLLFAVPNAALSQPWPVLGGHFFSALIGVACAQHISSVLIAAPMAVALAIAVMHYLHCLHPPGGATAMSAVIGGAQVHELGFEFVFTPVLLNTVIILCVAVVVNYPFNWRRYPAFFKKDLVTPLTPQHQLCEADFTYALSQSASCVDISEAALLELYRLAFKHAWQISAGEIRKGLYYSNGEAGLELSVRQILRVTEIAVTYRVVAGFGVDSTGEMSATDFSEWQKYEVIWKENAWRRIYSAGI